MNLTSDIHKLFKIHIPPYIQFLFLFQARKRFGIGSGLVVWYKMYRGNRYLLEVSNGH